MLTKTTEDSSNIMYMELSIKREINVRLELMIMLKLINKGPPNMTKTTIELIIDNKFNNILKFWNSLSR